MAVTLNHSEERWHFGICWNELIEDKG
uniref:Uncharacterized protein n=3 Tax=Anguilla anguilla TaxID=7936 RepID=A0A0E9PEC7_ANGAN